MSRLTSALALAASCLASEAGATIVVPMTIEQMSVEASCVARARVVNSQSAWDEGHRRIYTHTELQILERFHSRGSVPDTILVRTLGGEVGTIGMNVSGTPRFTLGEEVVVFLRNDPVDASQFQVIGMSQGKYSVDRPEKGGAFAVPSAEGLAFARPGSDGHMKIDATQPDVARIPIATMRDRVHAAVTGAVPVPPASPTLQTPPSTPTTPATDR